jgi:phosphoglucosamine mutase
VPEQTVPGGRTAIPVLLDLAVAEAEAALNGSGRLLVRPSGTEKLIRVMAEGDDAALVKRVVSEVSAAVKAAG